MSRGINFFGQSVEGHVGEHLATNPSNMTGMPVRTLDVLSKEAQNPWFMSIQSASLADWHRLWADTSPSGTSVVTRLPGVSKKAYTHINPLRIDGFGGGIFGQLWGGTEAKDGLVQLNFSGGQFNTPTVIGISTRKTTNNPTNFGKGKISEFATSANSSGWFPFNIKNPGVNLHPEDLAKNKLDSGGLVNHLKGLGWIDFKTGKLGLPNSQESISPGGKSIATGTLLLDNNYLAAAARGAFTGALVQGKLSP